MDRGDELFTKHKKYKWTSNIGKDVQTHSLEQRVQTVLSSPPFANKTPCLFQHFLQLLLPHDYVLARGTQVEIIYETFRSRFSKEDAFSTFYPSNRCSVHEKAPFLLMEITWYGTFLA
jgi:hypothetical protein